MVTHPIAVKLYSKFANSPAGFINANITLAGKCALMIYRKCGKEEARRFIDLIRTIQIMDYAGY